MDWRAKVELFEQIRREYEFGIGTIAGVSKKLKVHRRMVREAIGSALPVPRKKVERPRWKLATAVAFVDQILELDKKAPRKQRHTAHRIWERIQRELPDCRIGERTVRQYVHDRKVALGLVVHETFVPQSYAWGVEAQVDFHEPHRNVKMFQQPLQDRVRSLLLRIRLPFAFFKAELRGQMHIGIRKVSRCCQLVHGFESPIHFRSHRG